MGRWLAVPTCDIQKTHFLERLNISLPPRGCVHHHISNCSCDFNVRIEHELKPKK